MTFAEAVERKISRVREPQWLSGAYVKINIVDIGGKPHCGPWLCLYDRISQRALGEPTPQRFMALAETTAGDTLEEYSGAIDPEDKE